VTPEAEAAAREALAKIDQALAERPKKDDYVLSDATQALCTMRDALIADAPAPPPAPPTDEGDSRLETLNAVLGVVLGVHFPIGPVPWDDLALARGWLAGLLPG
jgi:hypothetical protein